MTKETAQPSLLNLIVFPIVLGLFKAAAVAFEILNYN